jgi:hypothetical protein
VAALGAAGGGSTLCGREVEGSDVLRASWMPSRKSSTSLADTAKGSDRRTIQEWSSSVCTGGTAEAAAAVVFGAAGRSGLRVWIGEEAVGPEETNGRETLLLSCQDEDFLSADSDVLASSGEVRRSFCFAFIIFSSETAMTLRLLLSALASSVFCFKLAEISEFISTCSIDIRPLIVPARHMEFLAASIL